MNFIKKTAYELYKASNSGRDVMEEMSCSGRPLTSSIDLNITKVKEIVTENPHPSLRDVAVEVYVPHAPIRTILINHLAVKYIAVWQFSMKTHIRAAEEMLERVNESILIQHV